MSTRTSTLDKARIINTAHANKKEIHGKITEGHRAGTIGRIVSKANVTSKSNYYSLRNVRILLRIEGRRDCTYLLSEVEVLEDYTGETVFVENKPEPQQVDVFDFLGQKISKGALIFFSRGNDAIMGVVRELRDNGKITVKPIKINEVEYKAFKEVRINVTDRVLVLNKSTLDAAMLLKLRI